jgi:hypothetical protein
MFIAITAIMIFITASENYNTNNTALAIRIINTDKDHVPSSSDSPLDKGNTSADSPLDKGNTSADSPLDKGNTSADSPLDKGNTSADSPLDKEGPIIKIIDPSPQSTIPFSEITVNGTTFDSGSGIQEVEAFAHKYPFNDVFEFKKANLMPKEEDGWSKWSISLPLASTGIYRILIQAKDNEGNVNWSETRINVPFFADSTNRSEEEAAAITSSLKKIALVVPTFTEAAYSPNAFYTFYNKYHSIPSGKNVTTDLNLLSAPLVYNYINPYTSIDMKNLTIFTPRDPGDNPIIDLAEHLRKSIPNNASVSIIDDEDIHNGYIFNSDNINTAGSGSEISKNVYDTLILFHDEYATQSMYNNYKRFVSNGGTIIFVDANVFIAEVNYNKANNTITLVNGHGWKFNDDGKSAIKTTEERWFNENAEWVGSNFLYSDIASNITFSNNPFNYTHFEENYVNNPRAKILIDYGVVVPKNSRNSGLIVASYELSYDKGKVIMTGLYGQKLISNGSFLKMLDSWILN